MMTISSDFEISQPHRNSTLMAPTARPTARWRRLGRARAAAPVVGTLEGDSVLEAVPDWDWAAVVSCVAAGSEVELALLRAALALVAVALRVAFPLVIGGPADEAVAF